MAALSPQSGRGRLSQGLIEVFTGLGKGKTSAALGVVLRAAGAGLRCHLVYFMKGGRRFSEGRALARLPEVSLARFGGPGFLVAGQASPRALQAAGETAALALAEARRAIQSDDYDVVLLDEINVALSLRLVEVAQVVELLRQRPPQVEVILTGRGAPPEILELADLVTEMVEIKHPYQRGIKARAGIDY